MVDISIIMPVYNTEKYLEQSINSVVVQQKISWELICIDDGSSDASLTILKKYELLYPQIRVITQAHQGLSIARNVGINLIKGRYIYFMDSDDYLARDALFYMVTMCDKKELDVFFMSFRNVCDDSNLNEKYAKMINKKNVNTHSQFQLMGNHCFAVLWRCENISVWFGDIVVLPNFSLLTILSSQKISIMKIKCLLIQYLDTHVGHVVLTRSYTINVYVKVLFV